MIKKTKAVKAATTKIKRIPAETILGTVKLARLANWVPEGGARSIDSSAAKTIPGRKFLALLIIFLIFFHLLSMINNHIINF